MFDLAWSHILLLGLVALLVIGPKDLPRALRTVGVWVGRARAIAREFQGSLDQMIREAELEEVRKEVEKAATIDVGHTIESTVDPGGEMKQAFAEPAQEVLAPRDSAPVVEHLPAPAGEAAPEAAPSAEAAEPQPEAPKSGTHN
jgi:sec-independent protein translocase protein TatB